MNELDGGHCHGHCSVVILVQHSSERLSEDVVSSGVDKRVDAEVDIAESNKDVKPLNRQQSALITSYAS